VCPTSELNRPHLICIILSRALVSNSEDALQNPYLVWENMLRLARLIKAMKFCGAITIAADCTKVRARLTYSTDFGSHILGSVLPLEECEVNETEDIDDVIAHIKKNKGFASQARAIIAKVSERKSMPKVMDFV
jgi:hypothetical protein